MNALGGQQQCPDGLEPIAPIQPPSPQEGQMSPDERQTDLASSVEEGRPIDQRHLSAQIRRLIPGRDQGGDQSASGGSGDAPEPVAGVHDRRRRPRQAEAADASALEDAIRIGRGHVPANRRPRILHSGHVTVIDSLGSGLNRRYLPEPGNPITW